MTLDILGVGNALLDIFIEADDADALRHDVPAGAMRLIADGADLARLEARAARSGGREGSGSGGREEAGSEARREAGGGVANACAVAAALGARTGLVACVGADAAGQTYAAKLVEGGVVDKLAVVEGEAGTGRCFVFVDAQGERAMATWLGAAQALAPAVVPEALVGQARWLLLEGYAWMTPQGRLALRAATAHAKALGRKVAFAASDPACFMEDGDGLRALAREADIIFTDARSARALAGLGQEAAEDAAVRGLESMAALTLCTLSERGALALARGEAPQAIAPVPAARVLDTTGAGDAFAGAFLAATVQGAAIAQAGAWAAAAGAAAVAHLGGRTLV